MPRLAAATRQRESQPHLQPRLNRLQPRLQPCLRRPDGVEGRLQRNRGPFSPVKHPVPTSYNYTLALVNIFSMASASSRKLLKLRRGTISTISCVFQFLGAEEPNLTVPHLLRAVESYMDLHSMFLLP